MIYTYEPFILRRLAENRVLLVNPRMPFENVIDCFHVERPFFLLSVLDDGRIAITPNSMVLPLLFNTEAWPLDIFPKDYEYVTIKNLTYPVIVTAHPLARVEDWFRKFEKNVVLFARETLVDALTASKEFQPLYPTTGKLTQVKEPVSI